MVRIIGDEWTLIRCFSIRVGNLKDKRKLFPYLMDWTIVAMIVTRLNQRTIIILSWKADYFQDNQIATLNIKEIS